MSRPLTVKSPAIHAGRSWPSQISSRLRRAFLEAAVLCVLLALAAAFAALPVLAGLWRHLQ